jgi:hypothetical protein
LPKKTPVVRTLETRPSAVSSFAAPILDSGLVGTVATVTEPDASEPVVTGEQARRLERAFISPTRQGIQRLTAARAGLPTTTISPRRQRELLNELMEIDPGYGHDLFYLLMSLDEDQRNTLLQELKDASPEAREELVKDIWARALPEGAEEYVPRDPRVVREVQKYVNHEGDLDLERMTKRLGYDRSTELLWHLDIYTTPDVLRLSVEEGRIHFTRHSAEDVEEYVKYMLREEGKLLR